MGRRTHGRQSIKGALRHWQDSNWEGVCTGEDGRILSPAQVKAEFLRQEALGHIIMPLCHAHECPDFDYFGGGCPGHFYLKCDEALQLAQEDHTHLLMLSDGSWCFDRIGHHLLDFLIAIDLEAPTILTFIETALQAGFTFPELNAEEKLCPVKTTAASSSSTLKTD